MRRTVFSRLVFWYLHEDGWNPVSVVGWPEDSLIFGRHGLHSAIEPVESRILELLG